MTNHDEQHPLHVPEEPSSSSPMTRRHFLKLTAAAGAVLGVGGGLGGLVAACGKQEAATTTTAGQVTETTAGQVTETTVGGGADATGDRAIRVGFVAPLTGALASFGVPDKYCVDRWQEAVADGVRGGDGRTYKIDILIRDSQSDTNRAAQVTGDLINNDKVDIMMAASTPDTVCPVADQCEALETPCVTNDCPAQPYVFSRGGSPDSAWKWTYHMWWGLEDVQANFFDIWDQVDHNKTVGALYPNDADGNAWRNDWKEPFAERGFKEVAPEAFQPGLEDFTAIISSFKNAGCEIAFGVLSPPDFANFWSQANQQGLKVKAATIAKALLFPQSVEALGDISHGMTTEVWWTPTYPFSSSLTGESCQELADDFTKRTGMQWTQPLLHYISFEVVVDAIKRAANPLDKNSIIEAVRTTKLDTIGGLIDFTAPVEWAKVGPGHTHHNVYKTPLVGGQWVKGTDYPFDLKIVTNAAAPMIEKTGPVVPFL